MKKKIFFIALSILIMIFGISYMAVTNYMNSQKSFKKAGYILTNRENATGNKSAAYYFAENTNYKNRFDNTVTFTDVNGEKVNVEESSFIHYNDDSIGVLKKSVVFNLEQIDNEIPIYYNIFSDTILDYNSNKTYSVDNLGKKIDFKNFIIKVDEDKFLIVGEKMRLSFDGDSDVTLNSNFLELNFVDEKVVTIENKDSKYQTISKSAVIHLNDEIVLNLDNRYLYVEDEPKLSIDQMIIDSSDNIEIQPIEHDITATEDPNAGEDGQEGSGGEEGSDDSIAGNGMQEQEIVESELTLPSADISSLEITANKIEGTIRINDKDGLVFGKINTSIIENSTGRVVEFIESEEGTFNIEVSSDKLTPETTYNLVTTVNYKKNNIEYTMAVVQYVFVTSALGVSVEKDYFTANSLNYNVVFDTYSKVRSCNLSIFRTTGELQETIPITNDGSGMAPVSFSGLKANTKYTIVLDNILYEDYIVSDDYSVQLSAKTLKNRPTIGTPSFSIDKKNGSFTLRLNNMSDPENGVESYRYEIYDTRTVGNGAGPVTTVEKNSLSSVEVEVNEKELFRSVGYIFRVAIEFYDNEKYIEYTTTYSDVMRLDGVTAPTLSWEARNVTFESIDGTIFISDPSNTINLEKPITVIYTNSIGTAEQYTATGNTTIPFIKNNLRANETYTISLYGTVDLQDGNNAIDNYHIGSILVNTNPTNPFNVVFEADPNDLSAAFVVRAQLKNITGADNRLEASTLTGITFVLHEGQSVSGRVVKSLKAVDRDLREYDSYLQEQYYDQVFTINPAFFGMSSSDLTAEYYTIEIKDAYDYTSFQNAIGINNNFITVRSNGALPEEPANPDDAVDFSFIRNKDAANIDTQLDATTIVGFKATANHVNTKRDTKFIYYHVYDADDCQNTDEGKLVCKEVANYTYTVPSDGSISEVTFRVGYGTPLTVDDNYGEDAILRRGHSYYVTYEADLDRNKDGEIDTHLPTDPNKVYRSQIINIPKQEAKIKMYPSKSDGDSLTIKYTYNDVDSAIDEKLLHSAIAPNPDSSNFTHIEQKTIQKSPNAGGTILSVKFGALYSGYLKIYADQRLYKSSNPIKKDYIKQMFSTQYSLPTLKYHIETDINRLIVYFDDYEANIAHFNKVASYDLKFVANVDGTNRTIEKKGVRVTGSSFIVDLFDVAEFVGKEITLTITANYDSELIGFDQSATRFAAQTIVNDYGGGEYFTIDLAGKVISNPDNASGSSFAVSLDSNGYVLTSDVTGKSVTLPVHYDEGGMVYNYNHYNLKQLKASNLTPLNSESETFSFSKIIPGVNMVDIEGNSTIVPLITTTHVSGQVFGFENGASEIKDNKIIISLFETDENGEGMNHLRDIPVSITEFENGIDINELTPGTSYAFELLVEVRGVGETEWETQHLYDLVDNSSSKTYRFATLSGVNFSKIENRYSATAYEDKVLAFSYKMDKTMGFEKIRYKFFERVLNPETSLYEYVPMDLGLMDEVGLQENMTLLIPIAPGQTPFKFNNSDQYLLSIVPVTTVVVDGESQEVELSNEGGDYYFNLGYLNSPFASINSKISSEYGEDTGKIEFKVTIYDRDRTIVGDTYTIQLLNEMGEDITPTRYAGQSYSTRSVQLRFTIDELPINQTYRFLVKYSSDRENNIVSARDRETPHTVKLLSSYEIDVGDVTALQNGTYANRVDLRFLESHQLSKVDTIMYSVYNSVDATSIDGSDNQFTTNLRPIIIGDDTIYTYALPVTLPSQGTYYIQAKFIFDNDIVADITVPYVYVTDN